MEEYIEKASVLIEALPYIQSFRDKTVVIKFGGSAMLNQECLNGILRDIVFMECVGINPVLIHGGGPHISERMKEAGLEPKFIQGLRVTDDKTISLVESVLTEINTELVQRIESYGGKAQGVFGRTEGLIQCVKHPPVQYKDESGQMREADIGFVGNVTKVNVQPIRNLTYRRKVAVLAPFGVDETGQSYNINADKVAGRIAAELDAEKLVFLSNVHGIYRDPKDISTFFSSLTADEIPNLVETGVIKDGMVPKVQSCLYAVENGVKKTHIIDGRMMHSLLLEIFTDKGVGTQILPTKMQNKK